MLFFWFKNYFIYLFNKFFNQIFFFDFKFFFISFSLFIYFTNINFIIKIILVLISFFIIWLNTKQYYFSLPFFQFLYFFNKIFVLTFLLLILVDYNNSQFFLIQIFIYSFGFACFFYMILNWIFEKLQLYIKYLRKIDLYIIFIFLFILPIIIYYQGVLPLCPYNLEMQKHIILDFSTITENKLINETAIENSFLQIYKNDSIYESPFSREIDLFISAIIKQLNYLIIADIHLKLKLNLILNVLKDIKFLFFLNLDLPLDINLQISCLLNLVIDKLTNCEYPSNSQFYFNLVYTDLLLVDHLISTDLNSTNNVTIKDFFFEDIKKNQIINICKNLGISYDEWVYQFHFNKNKFKLFKILLQESSNNNINIFHQKYFLKNIFDEKEAMLKREYFVFQQAYHNYKSWNIRYYSGRSELFKAPKSVMDDAYLRLSYALDSNWVQQEKFWDLFCFLKNDGLISYTNFKNINEIFKTYPLLENEFHNFRPHHLDHPLNYDRLILVLNLNSEILNYKMDVMRYEMGCDWHLLTKLQMKTITRQNFPQHYIIQNYNEFSRLNLLKKIPEE